MSMSLGVVVLAAGKGTRLDIGVPKPLAPCLGRPLLHYVLDAIRDFSGDDSAAKNQLDLHLNLVVGHQAELVKEAASTYFSDIKFPKNRFSFSLQKELKGTGDAVRIALQQDQKLAKTDYTLICCADTPMLTSEVFKVLQKRLQTGDLDGVAATFDVENPFGYGRIIRQGSKGFKIVEENEASASEQLVKEVNSGVYMVKTSVLEKFIGEIQASQKTAEYYLTDLFAPERSFEAVSFREPSYFYGINTGKQLEFVEKQFLNKKIESLRSQGVYIQDSSSAYIEWNVSVGPQSQIGRGVSLIGSTQIGQGAQIQQNAIVIDSEIGDKTKILANSYLENCCVRKECAIGPFARIRPGSDIGETSKIGNFVELKKSNLEAGVKISHLSYVGDTEIGKGSNIGCGFVTCNYDGKNKHKTVIGKDVFVGSDCQAVAPVRLGDHSFVAAGSTITKDVPEKGFAIARQRQVNHENAREKFLPINE